MENIRTNIFNALREHARICNSKEIKIANAIEKNVLEHMKALEESWQKKLEDAVKAEQERYEAMFQGNAFFKELIKRTVVEHLEI